MGESDRDLFKRFGQSYPRGTVLFKEGESGSEMYVIHAGRVRLTRGKGALEQTLAILPPGEFFGEMAIVMDRPRTATATVEEEARLLVLDSTTFETMVRNNAEIALRIIRKLAARLEAANIQVDILLRTEPNHRVVFALRNQADRDGRPEGPGVKVGWTVEQLAQKVGLPEKEVRQVVERLSKARLVLAEPDGFLIPQVGRLQDYLDFLDTKNKFTKDGPPL
ncbi:MAG: Crp/Fnr family transcriptional regulator [Polyangia bacterium]|jgi:CRP-like cAMP-binding protein|nr:Crp/Fnr family transcriptional regulator [Polyangia bacterium]